MEAHFITDCQLINRPMVREENSKYLWAAFLLIVFFQFFLNLLGNQRSFELCVYVIHFHQPPAV